MNHIKLGRYRIVTDDEDQGLRYKPSFWSRSRFLPFHDVRQVELFTNLLLIYHDNGIASLSNPRSEDHRPLLQALQNLPDAGCKEFDRRGELDEDFERLGAIVFYLAFMLFIAGLLYINPLDDEATQPITYIIFLVPALCLAYLIRQAASLLFKTFRKTR